MFCNVVKRVYICITKQGKRNISARWWMFECWRDTQQRGSGVAKEKIQQKFAKLKNILTFVIEKPRSSEIEIVVLSAFAL